ncbi:hypothetical protein SASPL_118258 [Salvia splendens]|uniref:Uncharacterized protein n=1 Tax=Salvia splendens TaxID=180675 RepID=A0A8X8XWF0_SALSN|nr:hypothetical protein SASPL_118258 [Salvia splendens]
MLSLQESEPQNYTHSVIKSIILVMLLAGTDTSYITIEWAMSALLNHPDKMEKAREEIDRVIGTDRILNESDLTKLPYHQNIETFPLFPTAPLLVPHEAEADCKIAGNDITRGTIVHVNVWAIHRDPHVWDDPESFKPEWFEAMEPRAPQLLPFGIGRQSCPGNVLAQRIVGLTLGCRVQCFYWERVEEGLVDMIEGKVGVSISKQVPLEAGADAEIYY